LSGGDNDDYNVGTMAGVTSFLGDQQGRHRDNNTDGGSGDNVDNILIKEGGSYINDLDNKLSVLSCLNDDECNMVEDDE
jgi:hypothetical protein